MTLLSILPAQVPALWFAAAIIALVFFAGFGKLIHDETKKSNPYKN